METDYQAALLKHCISPVRKQEHKNTFAGSLKSTLEPHPMPLLPKKGPFPLDYKARLFPADSVAQNSLYSFMQSGSPSTSFPPLPCYSLILKSFPWNTGFETSPIYFLSKHCSQISSHTNDKDILLKR